VLGMHFDVDQRYSLIDVVGRGAYGVVCAARDDANGGELVAIKKINSAFEHAVRVAFNILEIVFCGVKRYQAAVEGGYHGACV